MKKKEFLYWIPSIIWMIIIFILSSMTGSDLQRTFPFFSDFNWGHFVAYFVLAITYYWALRRKVKHPKIFFVIIFLSVLYGITDEFHQYFTPSRVPDVNDLLADAIGASLAAILLSIWQKKRNTRLKL
ncbi:VanZ family protein [Defluviitalea raffinosedens]|uniref:VanZ-like domain-containing protein n=1 Tax=Defluviitalea raffinosedens TaxID=1450156 RepID=A0A7C8LK74_9FIRM|nr:VanZ family protein [Defluviitalea raffinosedens]KAE9633227.1 hypothetical protein GND95_10180 [Defluviitalea raffinosedens]MBM7686954.1 VanZ family protein [Defluviitalea raffinosedens]HHW68078.1 VanZ family protein [Candidatus Epulonipiscium sp.]HOQ17785.1 VanZ family protein [Defluviitaleaceae bacterium]